MFGLGSFAGSAATMFEILGAAITCAALVFGSAAAGLVVTGHRTLAFVFVAVAVMNAILMYAWGQ